MLINGQATGINWNLVLTCPDCGRLVPYNELYEVYCCYCGWKTDSPTKDDLKRTWESEIFGEAAIVLMADYGIIPSTPDIVEPCSGGYKVYNGGTVITRLFLTRWGAERAAKKANQDMLHPPW